MKVNLICGKKDRDSVADILRANKLQVDKNADVLIAEDGLDTDVRYRIKLVYKKESVSELADLLGMFDFTETPSDILIGKSEDSYIPISINDVVYLNSVSNNTYANLESGASYAIKHKLYQLEETVLPDNFIRINKSEIVNIKKINLITPMFKGKLLVNLEGYKAPFDISRNYTKCFKERLGL